MIFIGYTEKHMGAYPSVMGYILMTDHCIFMEFIEIVMDIAEKSNNTWFIPTKQGLTYIGIYGDTSGLNWISRGYNWLNEIGFL